MMDETRALATIASSLRRKRREYDLVVIAEAISLLQKKYGGIREVSVRAGISPGMLRKFLSVFDLAPDVLQKVKSREIDRVMHVFCLSKLRSHQQRELAGMITALRLTTTTVRDAVQLALDNPTWSIEKCIRKVVAARPTSERFFAVVMPVRKGISPDAVVSKLSSVLRNSGVKKTNRTYIVFLTGAQFREAKKLAARMKVEVTDLAQVLVEGPALEA